MTSKLKRELDGEILVAARTDPGWVMLFPAAVGLYGAPTTVRTARLPLA